MAGSMMDFQPNFFKQYDECCLFIFAETENYSQFLISEQYAIAPHCTMQCKYERCKYHILLYHQSHDELWKLLRDKSFKYHNVDATYAYYKYYVHNGTIIESKGTIMEKLHKSVIYNRTHPCYEFQPSVTRKRMLRKKRKVHHPIINSRSVGLQTVESSLNNRIHTILRGKRAYDFMRMIDCFIDGHGSVGTQYVHFFIK